MRINLFLSTILGAMSLIPGTAAARTSGRVGYDAPECASGDKAGMKAPAKPRDPPAADMYGTSEILPAGALRADGKPMSWALHPRIWRGHDPQPGWKAMVPWGQVFVTVHGNRSRNTRVEVRDLRLFVRPKATATWCRLQLTATPRGAFYLTDFAGDRQQPGDQRIEPSGGRSFRPAKGSAIHFYGDRRVPIPAGGVSGVYADFEARLIKDDPKKPDDRRSASLVASAGTDYWITDNAPSGHNMEYNEDAAIGRFRRVTNSWRTFSMNTAARNALKRAE